MVSCFPALRTVGAPGCHPQPNLPGVRFHLSNGNADQPQAWLLPLPGHGQSSYVASQEMGGQQGQQRPELFSPRSEDRQDERDRAPRRAQP